MLKLKRIQTARKLDEKVLEAGLSVGCCMSTVVDLWEGVQLRTTGLRGTLTKYLPLMKHGYLRFTLSP